MGQEVISSIIEEHIKTRATQLNPYSEQPQELAEEAAIIEMKRTKKPELLNWHEKYETKAQELNKVFGDYTPEHVKFLRDFYKSEHITEEPYEADLIETIRATENPVISALYYWASKADKTPLMQMAKEFPEKYKKMEMLTQWIYYNKALIDNDPFVRVYRAVEKGNEEQPLRPWESVTTCKEFAENWCNNGKRFLVEYYVPVENIFASYESTHALKGLSGKNYGENELILNDKGMRNTF